MKPSKYIKKLARINVIKKRQRTRLSIIAICLSTAIIFTSLILFKNIWHFSSRTDYNDIGNYHYAVFQTQEISLSSNYSYTKDSDTGYYGLYQTMPFNLRVLTINDENVMPFFLAEGRYPETETELLVSDAWPAKVGDSIAIDMWKSDQLNESESLYTFAEMSENTTSNVFKVVGIYHVNDSFASLSPDMDLCYTIMPSTNQAVYFIKDAQIQLTDSASRLASKLSVDLQSVHLNQEVLRTDTIKIYLQDTAMILLIFVAILLIGIMMSMISVHNVVIISDKSRKKELGLLKSVGASPNDIKLLLQLELTALGLMGALLGIVLGTAISYAILNSFIDRIYMSFQWQMILDPFLILISLIGGILLMYFSGMQAYRKYIFSTVISDLKDDAYEYPEPVGKKEDVIDTSFSWKMFIIYNGRMKNQTKNIKRSFILLLVTCVLFMTVVLSNLVYNNRYKDKDYDFEITNISPEVNLERMIVFADPGFADALYDKIAQSDLILSSFYAERTLPYRVLVSGESFPLETFLSYQAGTNLFMGVYDTDADDNLWAGVYHYPMCFDNVQLAELEPYLTAGSLKDLTYNDVVAVYSASDEYGADFCADIKVGDRIAYDDPLDLASLYQKSFMPFYVAAIVVLPDEAYQTMMHFNYKDYPRVMGSSLSAFDKSRISESYKFKLENAAVAVKLQDLVDEVLTEGDYTDKYFYNNIVLIEETNRFATFMLEALFYPLFLMLFIVSLMNIHNVFMGNVHIKRSDISIMKSVGMTNKQLRKMFAFEYIEGYFNAYLYSLLIFIPIAMLDEQIAVDSFLDFGSNVIGTLFISLILGIVLILPLVYISLYNVQKILPIENLKDVD